MPGTMAMHATSRRTSPPSCLGTWTVPLALLGLFLLALPGCRKDSSDIEPPTGGTTGGQYTHVVGLVTDQSGAPVPGASITCGNKSATTDVAGAFLIRDVGTDGRCYARATKAGYFPGSAGVPAKVNGVSAVRITLLTDAPVTTFDVGTGTDHTLPGGAKVVIGPNQVVGAGGTPYSGTVSLAFRHLDPDAPEFPAIMPGGDLLATGADGDRQLQSFGMMMFRMTDGNGNELQLASGTTAEIAMPVPTSLAGSAPTVMPLWHFNEETGKWEEDGSSTLQGGMYVGTVGHFSSWNCDLPFDRALVHGLVLDCHGDPVEGVVVKTGQSEAVTDAQGRYERYVPAGLGFTIRVDAPAMGLTSEVVTMGPLSDGSETSVEDLHLNECPAFVEFNLVCTGGAQVMGYATLSWASGSVVRYFTSAGAYRLAVPHNGASAQLRIVHGNGAPAETQVTLPTAQGGSSNGGTFEVCPQGSGTGEYISTFTIHGDGHNNQVVTINTSGLTAMATYSVGDGSTVGFASGQSGTSISIGFPGNATGTWNVVDDSGDAMVAVTLGGNTYIGQDFTLQVTEYGAVGQHVRGTFSGTFARFDQVTMEMVPVTVSNGSFDLLRNPDEP